MSDLLDTDTCVAILRGVQAVARRVAQLPPTHVVYVSVISVAELFFGAQLSAQPDASEQAVRSLLSGMQVLPLREAEAETFAKLMAHLRRVGAIISDNDLYIAATALVGQHTIVTHNLAHFRRVPGLAVDDWL
ncbi:MAG: type II toxin-antitoxin system VapC family toxin [Chloroflexota bacterium]